MTCLANEKFHFWGEKKKSAQVERLRREKVRKAGTVMTKSDVRQKTL